jgi:surfactin synthase thioesterase subunit
MLALVSAARSAAAWYLMHDYAFSARPGRLPARAGGAAGEFADRIADALQGDVDEVLVVGHSSGAYLAVSVLADLIRAGRMPQAMGRSCRF